MIDRIVIENFKSLRQVDLKLGRLNLLVGANGSGKSNLLDALRVLQGIGNGFTISEIFDGKPEGATTTKWEEIRGRSARACFAGDDAGSTITYDVSGTLSKNSRWQLSITVSPADACVMHERLKKDGRWRPIYDSGPTKHMPVSTVTYYSGMQGRPPWLQVDRTRPALRQLVGQQYYVHKPDRVFADSVATMLANAQRIDPDLPLLRSYARTSRVHRMGDRGENFAALVESICKDEKIKDVYLSWLRELRPEEIDDVGVLHGAVGEPLFMLRENGRKFPASVLSDGTLRFAAVAAAFFQPDMPSLMTMEEIENGIHASRLRLLLDLLRSQAQETGTQIVATTHSATVLDWLSEDDYRTTFLCTRDEETGESRIRALADVPRFLDVVKKTPASELFAEGWLEAAP